MKNRLESFFHRIRGFISLTAILFSSTIQAQCLIPSGPPDTSFPVTNDYNSYHYPILTSVNPNTDSRIFKMAQGKGKIYLAGNFTHMAGNDGNSFIIDTATNKIESPRQLKVNGVINKAIPDGRGGFFVCGDFTRIGDSGRNYIAHINRDGQPTSWNPKVDNKVYTILIRNDTLFAGGKFTSFLSKPRNYLALYSIKGDSLLPSRNTKSVTAIHSILLVKDTLLFGGAKEFRGSALGKYRISDSTYMDWPVKFTLPFLVEKMQFSRDSGMILFYSDTYYDDIFAFNVKSGDLKYQINATSSILIPDDGKVFEFKVVGNKGYVVGYIEAAIRNSVVHKRKGFFSFDVETGNILSDDLGLDGYPTFLDSYNGKLFLSGKFNKIGAVDRLNFAVVDTGTYAVGQWQLSPTDALSSIAFYNNKAYVCGYFGGINAVKRNGFAAIDPVTKAILPWSASNTEFKDIKRMEVKGDTLFVLGMTQTNYYGCDLSGFNARLVLYSLADGRELANPLRSSGTVKEFLVDSSYLYVSVDNQVRRFSYPFLQKDPNWGTKFDQPTERTPNILIKKGQVIYSLSDNRYASSCNHREKTGWLDVLDSDNGLPQRSYAYKDKDPRYDTVNFEQAVLVNDKIYVKGIFKNLNGKPRKSFACIDADTGELTDWETPFTAENRSGYLRTSEIRYYNGKLWFCSSRETSLYAYHFHGLDAIDTSSGNLMPPVLQVRNFDVDHLDYSRNLSASDFIMNDSSLILAGSFERVNDYQVKNIFQVQMKPAEIAAFDPFNIVGADTIFANGGLNKYFITSANSKSFVYNWKYSGQGVTISKNGADTIWLKADQGATSGKLSVTASSYCGYEAPVNMDIFVAVPPTPPVIPSFTGIVDKCFLSPSARAKLLNPPVDAAIAIYLDGNQITYNVADSSFQYFESAKVAAGNHLIKVNYTDSGVVSVKQLYFNVTEMLVPSVRITGTPVFYLGQASVITAIPSGVIKFPEYEWQDSTKMHTWQVISGETDERLVYLPLFRGDKVRCAFTSRDSCATFSTGLSNSLQFLASPVTSSGDLPGVAKDIHIYPNPVLNTLLIDTLRLEDRWQTLEILNSHGQRAVAPISIQNLTRVNISMGHLERGIYIIVLRGETGKSVYKKIMKL